MHRPYWLLLPSVLLVACRDKYLENEVLLPVVGATTSELDFGVVGWGQESTRRTFLTNNGDVPMGVDTITINTGEMEDNWSVRYDFAELDCPEPQKQTATEESTADVGLSSVDTGGWGGDGGGGGGGSAAERIIPPKCKLPIDITLKPDRVGTIVGSLRVTTIDHKPAQDQDQLYWADPDNAFTTIFFSGEGERSIPNVYVSPRVIDFGTVWTGNRVTQIVDVVNNGGGPLTLGAPSLNGCDSGYALAWGYAEGTVIQAGGRTGLEVEFTAPSTSKADCTVNISSDDPDEPSINLALQANTGSDPSECPPSVTIVSPRPGYMHLDGRDLPVTFVVSDCNQPANSLKLTLRSGVLSTDNPVLVDTFYAPDESGYVSTTVPRDKLKPGTEALVVRAVDSAGNSTSVATSFLYRATYPDSDDDADGFGEDGETAFDCDDTDINSFPGAAERHDGRDNDCDGVIDEGTEGYDDDGDGYSEDGGDCDDNSAEVYPGALEIPDYKDNNCDGTVDESTTLADDDGDGYSESEGDCDDRDIEVHPGAVEYCDGLDNDCNGLLDERDGCIGLSTKPILVGCISASRTELGVGQTAELTTAAFDADGDALTYAWTQDSALTAVNYNSLSSVSGANNTFTAPSTIPGNKEKATYTIAVQVLDPSRNDDYCTIDLTVYAEPVETATIERVPVDRSCGGGKSLLLIPGAAVLGLIRRRRRATLKG